MREITLTKGQIAIVDDEDYDRLNQYKWYAHYDRHTKGYYAARNSKYVDGKRKPIPMHRAVLDIDTQQTDHINHNTLDNRKQNLRICSCMQNTWNRKSNNGSSKYKGVQWYEHNGKWGARCMAQGKRVFLGLFCSAIDAAMAYDNYARIHHGEFALLNTLPQDFGNKETRG